MKTTRAAFGCVAACALALFPKLACSSNEKSQAGGEAGDTSSLLDASHDAPDTSEASTCADGQLTGDETDVDCGGSCHPCNDYRSCVQNSDCTSGLCLDDLCQAAPDHCSNGVQDEGDASVAPTGRCVPRRTIVRAECAPETLARFRRATMPYPTVPRRMSIVAARIVPCVRWARVATRTRTVSPIPAARTGPKCMSITELQRTTHG